MDPFGTFKVYTAAGVDGKWFTTDDVLGDPATLEGERVLQGLPWYGSVGLYHLRNRWYSPTLQRFLSMDPLGFDAGDANLYRFEGNDPLGNLDPMGAAIVSEGEVSRAIGNGTLFGLLLNRGMAYSPTFAAGARSLGRLLLPLTLTLITKDAQEILTGKEVWTLRPLCPQEIAQKKRDLILGGLGMLSAGLIDFGINSLRASMSSLSGRAGSVGSTYSEEEASSSLAPREGGYTLSDKARGLFRDGKFREAMDVHYEDQVRMRVGGTSQIINGREYDAVSDGVIAQAKRSYSAIDKTSNFLNKSTRTQIKETISLAGEQGKIPQFWFKFGVGPAVQTYIENKGGTVITGLGE